MADAARSRRDFLKAAAAGAAGAAGLASASSAAASPSPRVANCIFINLIGGPSHLDTFDPKPDAPSDIRGPFRPIRTNVPGLHISELFPNLANLADKFCLLRGMHHEAPPIHEAGLQLLNTGRFFRDGPAWPNIGAVLKQRGAVLAWRLLPHDRVQTGMSLEQGFTPGFLGVANSPTLLGGRDSPLTFWLSLAVQALESGRGRGSGRFFTVNTFPTVFDSPSWDCHADRGALRTDLNDIRDAVAPAFDIALSQLLSDLDERGLLASTLVVATGEFGRTPRLNANGGRDHWAGCWTALVAGGGVRGGRVLGASDAIGSEPKERPTSPQELAATIYHAFGVPPKATIPGPAGQPIAVYPGEPLQELWD